MQKINCNSCLSLLMAGFVWAGTMMGLMVGDLQAEQPRKILLTPFQILSSDDLSYLQRGIEGMLTTRLAWPGHVIVVRSDEANPPGQADALTLAAKMDADYVVVGSLTILGDRVSTDARILETATQKQVLAFGRVGAQQSDVIDHVDLLVADIDAKLFGRVSPAVAKKVQTPKTSPQPSETQPSIYQHPEKLLE